MFRRGFKNSRKDLIKLAHDYIIIIYTLHYNIKRIITPAQCDESY